MPHNENEFRGWLEIRSQRCGSPAMAVTRRTHNKQLLRTVTGRGESAAGASCHYARASRGTVGHAAADCGVELCPRS
jgi:hypothetical protein